MIYNCFLIHTQKKQTLSKIYVLLLRFLSAFRVSRKKFLPKATWGTDFEISDSVLIFTLPRLF